jgi:outer membrane protein assembly factor BamB
MLFSQKLLEPLPLDLIWRAPLQIGHDLPFGIPAADEQHLFLITSQIEALALDTGKLLWQSPIRNFVARNVVSSKGMVFVAETTVSALDGETGRRLWEFTPDANTSLGRTATDGHALYFGTSTHQLYALRNSDGHQLWVIDLGLGWQWPAVVRGVATWKGKVYVTLEEWRSPNGHTTSGWLIAVEARNGKILWRYKTGEGSERKGLSSSPVVTSNLVIAADYLSNAIVAVNRKNGREAWRFEGIPGYVGFPEAPLVIDNIVYAASGDTFVYALELNGGRLLWRAKTPSAAGAYALCGTSLLVNNQGLTVLDRQTGRITQTLLHDELDFTTSGFTIIGNRAFVLGPKAVYAFQCR